MQFKQTVNPLNCEAHVAKNMFMKYPQISCYSTRQPTENYMNKATEPHPTSLLHSAPIGAGNELTACLQKARGLWGLLEWHHHIIIYHIRCCSAN